jgi:histone-lysine N-methyltransferase SETMAR
MKVGFMVYDSETKQKWSQWKSLQSPRAREVQQVCSSTKSMLIVFLEVKEILHREFVPPNTTVNADFYCVLRRLRENLRQKRPELWCNHNWLHHHDNTPIHTSLKTTELLTNTNMVIVPYPPFSPDTAPCVFALFPKFKMKLKGQHFEIRANIQSESQAVLGNIKENGFHSASEAWKK